MPSGGELSDLRHEIELLHEEIARLQSKESSGDSNSSRQSSANPNSDNTSIDEAIDGSSRNWREAALGFMHRRPYALPIAGVAILGIIASGYFLWKYLHSYESTSDAKVAGSIIPISSEVAGKISKVFVGNGQRAAAGQLLLEIDPQPYRLAVATAQAKYDAARAEAEIASRKYQDLTNSQQASRLPGGKQRVQDAQFEARQLLSVRLAAQHGAEAALEEARLQLQYTRISAPTAGIVGQASVSVGEVVGQSQRLMALVQTGDVWVKANFKETQLRRLHRGEPVTIHVDALGRDFEGSVESIAPATASEFSLLPAENASGNFVKAVQRISVRIDFKAGQNLSRLRPGMSVEPKVWVDHE